MVYVRLSDEEFNAVNENAIKAGCKNVSDYCRRMLLSGIVISVDMVPVIKIETEVNKIGVLLNQIAKVGNINGVIGLRDVQIIHGCMKELNNIAANAKQNALFARKYSWKRRNKDGNRKMEG